jgi:uncharacterized membrane protein (DUF485 family)
MQGINTQVDWESVERSEEFQELVRRRRAFVLPATIFFLAWYLAFVLLAGYAPDFMGRSVYQGFTVGYALALSQFVMVWGLAWLYLRMADRVFDPLAERAKRRALEQLGAAEEPSGRFTGREADIPQPSSREARTR